MVDSSRRADGSAPADSNASTPKSGAFRPVHGPRPAWPRASDVRAVQQSDSTTDEPQSAADVYVQDALASNPEIQGAEELYESERESALADQAPKDMENMAEEFEEEHFEGVANEETYLSPESAELAHSGSAWATETNPMAASNYRPSHTPAAERIKRLGAVDMADDLTEAVENYVATPFGETTKSSGIGFREENFEEQDFEDDEQPQVVVFDDVNEDPIDDHLMSASTIAAALARQAVDSKGSDAKGSTQKFANQLYAGGNVGDTNDQIETPRMPETPKWSESARHHMSTMLAASRDNVTPGDLTSRIDTSADRHRRSSAMMLLGLPALLMLGFGGAYIYHTGTVADGRTVVASLQSTISATALGIVADQASPATGKISESIIEKQEAESVQIVRPEPNLPPPIAPDLAESAPIAPTPSSEPAPAQQVASKTAPAAIEPTAIEPAAIEPTAVEPVAIAPAAIEPDAIPPIEEELAAIATSAPLIQSIPNLPPLDPPQQIAEAIEPVVAPVEKPVVVAEVEPKAVLSTPISPSGELPVVTKKEPTITPAGTGFLGRYFGSGSSEPAPEATPAEAPQQVAAIISPPKIRIAPGGSSQNPTEAALPDAQSSGVGGESDEDAQIIARGHQHLEIGDISAARLLFELAAQNGSPKAATAMGRSFDPVYFQIMGVRGVLPDAEKAVEWYEKAISAGDEEATEYLQKLAVWMKQ